MDNDEASTDNASTGYVPLTHYFVIVNALNKRTIGINLTQEGHDRTMTMLWDHEERKLARNPNHEFGFEEGIRPITYILEEVYVNRERMWQQIEEFRHQLYLESDARNHLLKAIRERDNRIAALENKKKSG